MQPQVYVLSKIDLVADHEVDEIISWTEDPDALELSLHRLEEQNLSLIMRDLASAVFATGLLTEPIPVSAKENSGLVELNAAVTRILTGGEEPSA
jgi:hypothetical protein